MPMIIFQQAKDMKLDPALFFISIIAIFSLYTLVEKIREYDDEGNEDSWKKKILPFAGVSGLLIGFAFCVKFTTLMLFL